MNYGDRLRTLISKMRTSIGRHAIGEVQVGLVFYANYSRPVRVSQLRRKDGCIVTESTGLSAGRQIETRCACRIVVIRASR